MGAPQIRFVHVRSRHVVSVSDAAVAGKLW